MVIEQSMDFYEYKDAKLSMRLPSYLHDKKRIGFLEARSKKDKQRPLFAFGIELLDDYSAEIHKDIMMRTIPGFTDKQLGIVRRGTTSYLSDGIENLTSTYDSDNGKTYCYYDVLFILSGHHVYAKFLGQDDLSAFEELCKQIVSSVRLIEGGDEPQRAKRRRNTGGLGREEKKRLTAALDGLPPEIAYLRRPILAIAKEDQDLLGSGEGDTSAVDQALQRFAKDGAITSISEAHADLLRHWLLLLPDHEGAWAGPAWFVEGVLRGYTLFGDDLGGS